MVCKRGFGTLELIILHDYCCLNPRVAFCGYSVPNSSENRINVGVRPIGTLKPEIDMLNIKSVCDQVIALSE